MLRTLIEKHYSLIRLIILLGSICLALFFGMKKQGYYIDEYYTYTIANGTQLGIAIRPGEWNDTSPYKDQLVSTGEENFRFGQMYENTANDVHPPLYYILVHFLSSVFSGVFSKWIGIAVNIILLIPALFLAERIAMILSGENRTASLLTMLFYGISPATMSNVMLIRMYVMLSLWTLLYAYLHVKALERDDFSFRKFLLPLFAAGFCGFLTQYFFVVIMFFISFVFAFYLLVFCRRIRDTLLYGLTALASLICTYFVWPYSHFHIFGGYRGKGALEQLLDLPNVGKRVWTHVGYLNRLVFGGLLPVCAVVLTLGVVLLLRSCVCLRRSGKQKILQSYSVSTKGLILLGLASLLSFAVLSQISLMTGGITCSRHQFAVYSLFMVLVPTGTYRLFRQWKTSRQIPEIVTAVMLFVMLISGYAQKSVLFLYEDEKMVTDYARLHPDEKVIMFQMDDGMYDTMIQELLLYPQIYYISAGNLETAVDETIAHADTLLVYMTIKADDEEACFESIFEQNDGLKNKELLWETNGPFRIYRLY